MNNRRILLATIGITFVVPRLVLAQQVGKTYHLCWLTPAISRSEPHNVAIVERLRELGFSEGRNLVIEFRGAGGRPEGLRALAKELAQENCEVFLSAGTESTLVALKEANPDKPIIMLANDFDPVATGHVASLARPGGRITGISMQQGELPAKRIEVLKELLPASRKIGVLADASTTGQLKLVQGVAKRIGVEIHVFEFRHAPYDFNAAFAEFAQQKVDAVLPLSSGFFVPARKTIPELALKYRLPGIYNHYLWTEAGGLLSYGADFAAAQRQAADQIGKVFRGTKPADIPVEQASVVELVINLKTAKALGIALPPTIKARADRFIE